MWERWPNFHFITMLGNLFFFHSTHSLLVLLTETILKILQFCCKEPDTVQLEKGQLFSIYPYNHTDGPFLIELQ